MVGTCYPRGLVSKKISYGDVISAGENFAKFKRFEVARVPEARAGERRPGGNGTNSHLV